MDNIGDMNDRKWRTSFLISTGCNVLVVVYDCGYEDLKASIYINEIPVQIKVDNYTCIKCPLDKIIELIESFQSAKILPRDKENFYNIHKAKKEEKKAEKDDTEVTPQDQPTESDETQETMRKQKAFREVEETYEEDVQTK